MEQAREGVDWHADGADVGLWLAALLAAAGTLPFAGVVVLLGWLL